jgi:hypothetical protein
MLRGQIAIFLSCSEKFKQELAWPVRDALASCDLRAIVVTDEPPLPNTRGDDDAKLESYLSACSAFVALCTADHKLSDGAMYPRVNIADEIQRAYARPHLRDHAQILTSPGVLLPSDITSTFDGLDVAEPAKAAEVILDQLAAWGLTPGQATGGAPPRPAKAGGTADLNALVAGLEPADREEARRRAYETLRDRDEAQRRAIARALHREVMQGEDQGRRQAAASLLEAASGLDASLVPTEMIELLASGPGYLPRSCAANLMLDRAAAAPLDVPVELLGRLARPHGEDWCVSAPAMAAVKELALTRRDACAVLESLAASAEPQDRYAVAQALLDIAVVKPGAVAAGVADRLTGDADPLVAGKAREVMTAVEHVTDDERAGCYGHFRC